MKYKNYPVLSFEENHRTARALIGNQELIEFYAPGCMCRKRQQVSISNAEVILT